MRVMLLCQADADFQTQRVVEMLRAEPGFEVVRVGRGGTSRTPALAAWRVLRAKVDLVHAFGASCLRVASFARKPVLFTPAPLAKASDARWLRSAAGHVPLRTCCLSGEDHRLLVERGVPVEKCELVHPGVKAGAPAADAAVLRQRLGLAGDERAVLLLAEAGRWGDARLGAHVVSILHSLDGRYRLMLWGAGRERVAGLARRWSKTLLCDASAAGLDFAAAAGAADLALLPAEEAFPQLPVLTCMAAGVPLVATATRAVGELLEDHHTALLAVASPKRLAQRLLMLAEDAALQKKLADAARAEAYKLFPVSGFLQEMRRVYHSVMTML